MSCPSGYEIYSCQYKPSQILLQPTHAAPKPSDLVSSGLHHRSLLDILGTDGVPTKIHDICNGDVGENIGHPQRMVEGGDVERMVVAIPEKGAGKSEVVSQEVTKNGDILDLANVVGAVLGISLLPVPPEPVQIGVVKEEERFCRRCSLFHHVS